MVQRAEDVLGHVSRAYRECACGETLAGNKARQDWRRATVGSVDSSRVPREEFWGRAGAVRRDERSARGIILATDGPQDDSRAARCIGPAASAPQHRRGCETGTSDVQCVCTQLNEGYCSIILEFNK